MAKKTDAEVELREITKRIRGYGGRPPRELLDRYAELASELGEAEEGDPDEPE